MGAAERDEAARVRSKLESDLKLEQSNLARVTKINNDTQAAIFAVREAHTALEEEYDAEKRRLLSDILSLKADKKDIQRELDQAKNLAQNDQKEAEMRERSLHKQIDEQQQEVAEANDAKADAEARLERETLKRCTAIVESQVEKKLREATETTTVFDHVRYDMKNAREEGKDLDRVLDAATYR